MRIPSYHSLASAGRLDLHRQIANELITPHAVFEEIAISGRDKRGAEEVKQESWIKRVAIQDRSLLEHMPRKLSRGESEAILLAKELGGHLLVDEFEARKEAARLGISYFGALRIIKEAKDRRILPKVKPVLNELVLSVRYGRVLSKDKDPKTEAAIRDVDITPGMLNALKKPKPHSFLAPQLRFS